MRDFWGAQMSMIFQDPMTSLNPVMKIGKQITESIRQHLDVDEGLRAASSPRTCCASVRIPEPQVRLKEYPHQLSGGMRQRVCIAVALACGPKLLFADEPTTALDVTVQAQVLDLMGQQQRERFMAMVLITHDLGVVAGRADEIAVMYAGRIVEKAPTRVLFSRHEDAVHRGAAVVDPEARRPSHTRLATIPGRPPDLVNPPVGLQVRAAVRLRAGPLPRRGAAAARRRRARPPVPLLVSRSARPKGSKRWSATSARASSPLRPSRRRNDLMGAG